MNFQVVSVGQKLIESGVGNGGYLDATGTPSPLLLQEIEFVDAAVGEWVTELKKEGLYEHTLIIMTAKHGQSPIDSQRYIRITSSGPVTTSPSRLLDSCLPASESNAGGQIGPTEDDISLLWLKSTCNAANEVQTWKRNRQLLPTSPVSARSFEDSLFSRCSTSLAFRRMATREAPTSLFLPPSALPTQRAARNRRNMAASRMTTPT
jgi:hypothetical protein